MPREKSPKIGSIEDVVLVSCDSVESKAGTKNIQFVIMTPNIESIDGKTKYTSISIPMVCNVSIKRAYVIMLTVIL